MTQSHKYLVIPESWLENRDDKITKNLYSPNQNEDADFNLPVKYFFNEREKSCYNAYIIRTMREYKLKIHKSYFYLKFIYVYGI